MIRGDHRGCVDSLRDDLGSPILSAMRIDCARELATTDLRDACELHRTRHDELADGCAAEDLRAREYADAGGYEACVRTLEPLEWTPQRSIAISECANQWNTPEARLRLCEFIRRRFPPSEGAQPCGGTETLEVVLQRKAR